MAIQNEFFFIGRLVRDPVQSETKLGTPRAFYVLACNEHYVDRKGQRAQRTDFIPIASYGQQALNDMKYLRAGKEVAVKGRIRQWYSAATQQGGFEFEADAVRYLGSSAVEHSGGRSRSAPGDRIDDPEVLEFIAQMDAVASGSME